MSAHIAETHRRWKLAAFVNEQGPLPPPDDRFPGDATSQPVPRYWRKEGYHLPSGNPQDFGPFLDNAAGLGGLLFAPDLDSGTEVWRSEVAIRSAGMGASVKAPRGPKRE